MKMKIRCGLLAVLLLGSSVIANAGNGIKRSEWSFKPEITTSNVVYGVVGMIGLHALGTEVFFKDKETPWWYPTMQPKSYYMSMDYKTTVEKTTTNGKRTYTTTESKSYEPKDQLFDFGFPCYSFGGTLTYMSKEVPLGFWTKVVYERVGFSVRPTVDKGEYTSFSKNMIVPEVGIKIRFGKYRTAEMNWTLDIGASYDYALSAKGEYNGTSTVNNGFTGIIGFGGGSPEKHFEFGINIGIPFYNYFNKSYSPDGGVTFPYENVNAKTFMFSEYIRFGF